MATAIVDKATSDKISFISFIIPKFAESYKMNMQDAYFYLKKYGGMDYLNEFWWTLHVEDPMWSTRDLYEECYRNGGLR